MAEPFTLRMHPELKEAIGQLAEAQHVPMNDLMHKALAEAFGLPHLSQVPKQPVGRKPQRRRRPAVA